MSVWLPGILNKGLSLVVRSLDDKSQWIVAQSGRDPQR